MLLCRLGWLCFALRRVLPSATWWIPLGSVVIHGWWLAARRFRGSLSPPPSAADGFEWKRRGYRDFSRLMFDPFPHMTVGAVDPKFVDAHPTTLPASCSFSAYVLLAVMYQETAAKFCFLCKRNQLRRIFSREVLNCAIGRRRAPGDTDPPPPPLSLV